MFNSSQFNGNGFMQSPENANGGSAQKRNYDPESQSIRKLAIRQIYSAMEQGNGDELIISGKPVSNIGIVGKIISVNEEQVTINMVVDDGTGRITAKWFLQDGDADIERQRLAELTPGKYVRMFGHLSSTAGAKHLQVFAARPITDHNEVTYHLSQVIFQHLHLSKGGSDITGAFAMPEMNGAAAPAGGFGAAPAAAAAGGFGASGLNPIQDDILKIFNAPDAMNIEAGLTAQDIMARAAGRYNKAQVDDAISYLVNDGHLYSTIDDQHFKSCNT